MKKIVYRYRGNIERWSSLKRSYVWKVGFSEDGEFGGGLYPWMTKAECRADAKSQGGRAVFVEERVT